MDSTNHAHALGEYTDDLRVIAASTHLGMLSTNEAGTIRFVNAEAARMFGYEVAQLLGGNVALLLAAPSPAVPQGDAPLGPMPQTLGRPRTIRGRRKNGETFSLEITVGQAQVDQGRVFTAVLRELHSTPNDPGRMFQAERLSSIGLLAAGVAHEVNNPLAGVMACLKALEENRVAASRRPEYFAVARQALERIHQVVRGLEEYARLPPSRPAQVDIRTLIDTCVDLITPWLHQKNLRLTLALPEETCVVHVDPSQVTQALMNVLLNAMQASPQNGEVTISVTDHPDTVAIDVRDQGPGIPAEHLARICDPFFTTKDQGEGTGLGLTVTLGVVENHGGKLEFSCAEGQGTQVRMWLPRDG